MKNKIYGYCRISTPKQNVDRQIRNILSQYPEAIIVQEAYTGTTLNRPQWNRLFQSVKTGDTVVFDSVSRMSRDALDGYAIYEQLYNKGVSLVFLKEKQIDTDTYKSAIENSIPMTGTTVDYILEGINKYLLSLAKEQIRIAFEQSEKEVTDLKQRTREGIETARLNGKQIGGKKGGHLTTKKSIVAKKIILQHSKDFGGSLKDEEVRVLAGISRNTFYRYKQALRIKQMEET